jgi:hypothetical protein
MFPALFAFVILGIGSQVYPHAGLDCYPPICTSQIAGVVGVSQGTWLQLTRFQLDSGAKAIYLQYVMAGDVGFLSLLDLEISSLNMDSAYTGRFIRERKATAGAVQQSPETSGSLLR